MSLLHKNDQNLFALKKNIGKFYIFLLKMMFSATFIVSGFIKDRPFKERDATEFLTSIRLQTFK